MSSEDLVEELLKHYDSESIKSIKSIASMIDDMKEDEPCIVSNVYRADITNTTQNNISLSLFENSPIIAQCTVCSKVECKTCSSKETDCPLYGECNTIEEFVKKNGLMYEDIKRFIEKKIYPQNVDKDSFDEFMKTSSLFEKEMYKVELVMTGAPGFGKVALYTALNHLKGDNDGIVFLSMWKNNKEFLEKYYEKIGFETYNKDFGKMRILSLKNLLSRLSTEQLPDSFAEIHNTLEPYKVFRCLLKSRQHLKRSRGF